MLRQVQPVIRSTGAGSSKRRKVGELRDNVACFLPNRYDAITAFYRSYFPLALGCCFFPLHLFSTLLILSLFFFSFFTPLPMTSYPFRLFLRPPFRLSRSRTKSRTCQAALRQRGCSRFQLARPGKSGQPSYSTILRPLELCRRLSIVPLSASFFMVFFFFVILPSWKHRHPQAATNSSSAPVEGGNAIPPLPGRTSASSFLTHMTPSRPGASFLSFLLHYNGHFDGERRRCATWDSCSNGHSSNVRHVVPKSNVRHCPKGSCKAIKKIRSKHSIYAGHNETRLK